MRRSRRPQAGRYPSVRRLWDMTLREPYGVVAAIVPYNMPVAMLSNKLASALAAGNTVVIKPPEQASVACLRFAELVNDILPPAPSTSCPDSVMSGMPWCETSTSLRSR